MIPVHTHPAEPAWASAQVASLPPRWQRRLFNRWEKTKAAFDASVLTAKGDATRSAAYWLQDMLARLNTVNIPLDASDGDICDRAELLSKHCAELGSVFKEWELRSALETVCRHNSVKPPYTKNKTTAETEVNRMICPMWWRRQLRKVQAQAVESAAISIGYVNKTRDLYVSNESLVRRRQQNKRNADMLENTRARNEDGQEYTLAELAATSTSNKAIKRGELMTRIAGFERIAVDCGHVGLFFTMTAPSRMHKWRTVAGGRVVENSKYDGTTPKEAQAHHSKVWGRIRAKLAREGFKWYGFRIAEPNHDGTPHWHLLVFFDGQWRNDSGRASMLRVQAIIRRYALQDSGNEAGAKRHRVDFVVMDAAKGTAAGYIAKYVSKNIDGHKVEKDLYGQDTFTSSQRVEAWAATWSIRQFQQVGGPPVTVWRELRRIKSLPDGAPAHLVDAHSACNKVAAIEGETASVAWDRYTRAQGGVFCGREYRIKVSLENQEGNGRYGEALGLRPVGVQTVGTEAYRDGLVTGVRSIDWFVRSARKVWEIIRAVSKSSNAGIARAWTRVNNCTQENLADMGKRFKEFRYGDVRSPNFEFCGPVNWPAIEKSINGGAR